MKNNQQREVLDFIKNTKRTQFEGQRQLPSQDEEAADTE